MHFVDFKYLPLQFKMYVHRFSCQRLLKEMLDIVNKIYSEIAILPHLRGQVRRRFAAAFIPRLFWNNIPGHTTRAPPMQTQRAVRVGFKLAIVVDRRHPVQYLCQLGQDIPVQGAGQESKPNRLGASCAGSQSSTFPRPRRRRVRRQRVRRRRVQRRRVHKRGVRRRRV